MIAMAMAHRQRRQVPATPQASQMHMFSSHLSNPYQSPLQAPNVPHSTQHSFYINVTGTTLQETREKYQNLSLFKNISKKIFVFDIVIFSLSKFPIHFNNMFHCIKILLSRHLHAQSKQ